MGIGIDAWRARIGGFVVFSCRITSSVKGMKVSTLWSIVRYLLVCLLLACGGVPVHPNPGPVNGCWQTIVQALQVSPALNRPSTVTAMGVGIDEWRARIGVFVAFSGRISSSYNHTQTDNDFKVVKGLIALYLLLTCGDIEPNPGPLPINEDKEPQGEETPRPFFAKSHAGYTSGKKFPMKESSPDPLNLFEICFEFKEFGAKRKESGKKEDPFLEMILKFICACMNERCNGRISLGVLDNGIIKGVGPISENDKKGMERRLSDALQHKICNTSSRVINIDKCIKVVFVPVLGKEQKGKYVIEVDVCPFQRICHDAAFGIKRGNEDCDYYRRRKPDQTERVPSRQLKQFFYEVKTNAVLRRTQEEGDILPDFLDLMTREGREINTETHVLFLDSKNSNNVNFNFLKKLRIKAIIDLGSGPSADIENLVLQRGYINLCDTEEFPKCLNEIPYLCANDIPWDEWSMTDSENLRSAVKTLVSNVPDIRFVFLVTSIHVDCLLNVYGEVCTCLRNTAPPVSLCSGEMEYVNWKEKLLEITGKQDYNTSVSHCTCIPYEYILDVMAAADPSIPDFTLASSFGTMKVEDLAKTFPGLTVVSANYGDESFLHSDVSGANIDTTNREYNHLCERDVDHKVREKVDRALYGSESVSIVTVYHQPGAGGTTAAMKCLWGLRKNYRVCILDKITSESKRQLFKLWEYAEPSIAFRKPIVVLIENDILKGTQISELANEIEQNVDPDRRVAFVILHVVRCNDFHRPRYFNSSKAVYVCSVFTRKKFLWDIWFR